MRLFPKRRSAAIGAFVIAVSCAEAAPLEETFARMDRAAATFTGLKADLQRLRHTAVLNEDEVETGTFLMKRPKPHDIHVLFDIKQPEPRAYAYDGHKLESYLPGIQTVSEYEAGKYKGLAERFLLLGFGTTSKELTTAYSVSVGGPETVANEKTVRLELIPKSPEMQAHLTKVELWISNTLGVPIQQKLYAPGGNYDVFTYSNVMINPNLADSAVRLNVPKGTKREHPLK